MIPIKGSSGAFSYTKPANPKIRWSPYAWAKLKYLCHRGDTEVAGFGISDDPADPFKITDFVTVKQTATACHFSFDDDALADFQMDMIKKGLTHDQFWRVWIHTHPSGVSQPSGVDEDTFAKAFGKCDWMVMAILARSGETYARLRFNVGPGGHIEIPMVVDYGISFPASDKEAWNEEYQANIIKDQSLYGAGASVGGGPYQKDPYSVLRGPTGASFYPRHGVTHPAGEETGFVTERSTGRGQDTSPMQGFYLSDEEDEFDDGEDEDEDGGFEIPASPSRGDTFGAPSSSDVDAPEDPELKPVKSLKTLADVLEAFDQPGLTARYYDDLQDRYDQLEREERRSAAVGDAGSDDRFGA